jgi:Xaa-Pro aminopeptidase
MRSVLPITGAHRALKSTEEIEQIRRAIEVTHLGLLQAWKATRPGIREYEVDAELTAEFLRRGAHGHSFYPIIASGLRATVMHYMKNDAIIGPEDLVLFDVGADVGYYSADISRAIPASGHFTDRQRAVYDALLRVQRAGIALHKPGASVFEIDEAMRSHLREELAPLGLIKKGQKDIPRMLSIPHGSHHLGLDLHDTGDPRAKFVPGMVVTCEPGIYLIEERIGIRLEDDILIKAEGHEVLSKNIPSDPDEIEALLKG